MRALSGTALLAGLMMMLACSGQTSGSPNATHNTSTANEPKTQASPDVPRVPEPIRTARLEENPCDVLTSRQLSKISIKTQPEPELDNMTGPECEWDSYDETGIRLYGTFLTSGGSLAGSYKKHRSGELEDFKPDTFAGYPGYVTWKNQAKDSCDVTVALRNDLLYTMNSTVKSASQHYGDPCPVTKKAAAMAVETMKQRGS